MRKENKGVSAMNAPPLPQSLASLKPIPIVKGLPIFGHTFALLKDSHGWGTRMNEKYGDIFRYSAFFQDWVGLAGPEAAEFLALDKDNCLSAEHAYRPFFGHLAVTSVLLMDFEEHRKHRQALNPSFKSAVMKTYLEQMHRIFSKSLPQLAIDGTFLFYPAIKQLTLDVATSTFLGIDDHKECAPINKALTDLFDSALAIVRLPLPGTKLRKGLKAKEYLVDMLRSQIPERKARDGQDLFTRLCQSEGADGNGFSDDDIIGHLLSFWLAGHDTLASSLTTLVYLLGKNPEWQQKLRNEIMALKVEQGQPSIDDLKELELCDYAFKETLRHVSPAAHTPRRALKDIAYNGYVIPKGTIVSVGLRHIHEDEKYWPEPKNFDPMRFAPENIPADRHQFAWAPYGGGAHKCIGMIFAQIQAKVFLLNLLPNYRITIPENYELDLQLVPTPRPKDGLPVTFVSLQK
ncbi:MAG: cytochrome P450 [Kordiimonadaceae bacterium]|nr:cytochrome P450 [Kordiimonadaceae bacterium]